MTGVNPFADDPDRAAAWDQGYEAGFAEPESDHLPPLESELLDVFGQGETTGRDDRRSEPSSQNPLPSSETADFSRFETAPDGTLIPIPDEAPEGNAIRSDALITVNPRTAAGYYVAIFNGPPESNPEAEHFLQHVLTEAALVGFEHLLAHAVREGAHAVLKFGGLGIGVAISLFTSSPILGESRFRGYLEDGSPIAYVVLTPES